MDIKRSLASMRPANTAEKTVPNSATLLLRSVYASLSCQNVIYSWNVTRNVLDVCKEWNKMMKKG
jgi:hypothetical protein